MDIYEVKVQAVKEEGLENLDFHCRRPYYECEKWLHSVWRSGTIGFTPIAVLREDTEHATEYRTYEKDNKFFLVTLSFVETQSVFEEMKKALHLYYPGRGNSRRGLRFVEYKIKKLPGYLRLVVRAALACMPLRQRFTMDCWKFCILIDELYENGCHTAQDVKEALNDTRRAV